MLRPAPRHLLAPTLAAALLLSACGPQETADTPPGTTTETASPGGDEGTASPEPTATASETTPAPTDDPSPAETPAPTSAPPEPDEDPDEDQAAQAGGDVPDLGDHCVVEVDHERVERIEFAAPTGWQVEGSCEFFDPVVEQVEPNTEAEVAVIADVSDTPFHEAASSDQATRDEIRHVGARSGHQAVRVRAESTGQGLYPEGTPVLYHLVDLDPGTDEAGGTLVLSARPSEGADFDLAAEALDRMIDTVRVVPAAGDRDDGAVVSRVEGGGTPWTVTLDDGCFRLHGGGPGGSVLDETCDLGAPDGTIQGTVLEGDAVQVVAGLAPPLAARVASDAASAPYGAVTQPMEGAAAFAYTPIDVPVEVRALDVEGERLASATVR